jgi:hypothetical protein
MQEFHENDFQKFALQQRKSFSKPVFKYPLVKDIAGIATQILLDRKYQPGVIFGLTFP